jgi:hypothetical protein
MKVAPGNADVSPSGDFRRRRCFDATPRDSRRVGQVAQPLRLHLRHLDDFSLASQMVHPPTCLPFSKYPDRILVPSLLNHSQNPVSASSTVRPLDGSVLVTVDAFLHQGLVANIPSQPWKKCRSPDSGKAMSAFCSRGNEQSPEFLAGRPVKKSSLTQPFYRP